MKRNGFYLMFIVISFIILLPGCLGLGSSGNMFDGKMLVNGQDVTLNNKLYADDYLGYCPYHIFEQNDSLYLWLNVNSFNKDQKGPKAAFNILMAVQGGVVVGKHYSITSSERNNLNWSSATEKLVAATLYYYPYCTEMVDTTLLWNDESFLNSVYSNYYHLGSSANYLKNYAREMRMTCASKEVVGYVFFSRFESTEISGDPGYELKMSFRLNGTTYSLWNDSLAVPVKVSGSITGRYYQKGLNHSSEHYAPYFAPMYKPFTSEDMFYYE